MRSKSQLPAVTTSRTASRRGTEILPGKTTTTSLAGLIPAGSCDYKASSVPDHEIESAVSKVFETQLAPSRPFTPRQVFDTNVLVKFASRAPAADADFFKCASPLPIDLSPAFALSKLFAPKEKVLIFDKYKSQGQYLWTNTTREFSFPSWLTNNNGRGSDKNGIWFLCAPVDGCWHPNPREGAKASRRSEESCTRFPYIVLESDSAPKELWLRALARLPLPIAMIADSGGNSIHALVKVDAGTKAQCDKAIAEIEPTLTILGADSGALTAVQLTRLPNCFRQSKGTWQRLLYLDDNPDDTPIIDSHCI